FWDLIGLIVALGVASVFAYKVSRRLKTLKEHAEMAAMAGIWEPEKERKDELSDIDSRFLQASVLIDKTRPYELSILQNPRYVFCSHDNNLRFNVVGESSVSAWGYDSGDLLGRSLLTLVDEGATEIIRRRFAAGAEQDTDFNVEITLKCGTQWKDFEWTVAHD